MKLWWLLKLSLMSTYNRHQCEAMNNFFLISAKIRLALSWNYHNFSYFHLSDASSGFLLVLILIQFWYLFFLFLKMDCLRQFFFMSRVGLGWEMETTMLFLCYLHIDIIILTVFKNIGFIWSCPKKKVCGFWLARDCIRSSLHDMTKIFLNNNSDGGKNFGENFHSKNDKQSTNAWKLWAIWLFYTVSRPSTWLRKE